MLKEAEIFISSSSNGQLPALFILGTHFLANTLVLLKWQQRITYHGCNTKD